jgi:poly(hydroxyalkanoate) depolymerase family esterase
MKNHFPFLENMREVRRQVLQSGSQGILPDIQAILDNAKLPAGDSSLFGRKTGRVVPREVAPVMHDINPRPFNKSKSEASNPDEAEQIKTNHFANRVGPGLPTFATDLLTKLNIVTDSFELKGASKKVNVPIAEGAQFLDASYTNLAGTRRYKLYVPAGYQGKPLPLVVMLHGCTQDPDDFANGTQMNTSAELQKCLVLYPQQSHTANSSKCWNWFNPADQHRDAGEPSLIAGMTREVMSHYQVDQRQVFIAGLSAGGAMAVIMGIAYPELYSGVAVHSGLPAGAASDLPSALAAMQNGLPQAKASQSINRKDSKQRDFKGIPIIVFHGDADRTVNMKNGTQIIADVAPHSSNVSTQRYPGAQASASHSYTHSYTQTVHQDQHGKPVAEHWLIHGCGHAWAGGSGLGSYTDPRGPDATKEMMRFFYTHSRSN